MQKQVLLAIIIKLQNIFAEGDKKMENSKENKPKGRPKKGNKEETYKNTPVCNNLNKLFGERNESQETVATALGTTRQSFGNWLSGRNQPDYEKLVAIADYYNVSTDYLLGRTDKDTGLGGNATNAIKELNNKRATRSYIELLSILLENNNLAHLLGLMEAYITSSDNNIAFTPETMSVIKISKKEIIKLAINDEIHDMLNYIKPIFLNNAIPTEVKMINYSCKKGLISENERIQEIDDFYKKLYNN